MNRLMKKVDDYLSPQKARATVKHWEMKLQKTHRMDKDGKRICEQNLQIAKDHLAFVESVQPTQLKLSL